MSFMFPCGMSKGLKLPAGKTCVPDGTTYKTKASGMQQECKYPTRQGVGTNTGCCVSSHPNDLKTAMVMYARRTRTHLNQYNYLENIYKWYRAEVGPIRAHDTAISLVYPPNQESFASEYNAFAYLQPEVKSLHVYSPDVAVNPTSFVDWYKEINNVFRIRERHDMEVTYMMDDGDTDIDNEYFTWVIKNMRPKASLTFELNHAFFVDNDVGPLLNAAYSTENFRLAFEMTSRGSERIADPTNNIVRAGFVEDEERQAIIHDEENPEHSFDRRVFDKAHCQVEMTLFSNRLQLSATTSHAYV